MCASVCAHTQPLPFVARNHILSGPSTQYNPPSLPHFSPGSLSRQPTFPYGNFFSSDSCDSSNTDTHFLILLALLTLPGPTYA